MKVIIDRIEGNYAVVEISKGKMVTVSKELFAGATEGDVVEITVLKKETEERKKKIEKLMDNVFED